MYQRRIRGDWYTRTSSHVPLTNLWTRAVTAVYKKYQDMKQFFSFYGEHKTWLWESCFVKSALAPCHTIERCASDRCGLMGINRKFGLPLCPSFRIGPNRKSILLGGVFLATGTKSAQNLCDYDSSEGYLSIYTSERKLLAEFTNISKQESTFHFVFGNMDHPCCLLKHVYIISSTTWTTLKMTHKFVNLHIPKFYIWDYMYVSMSIACIETWMCIMGLPACTLRSMIFQYVGYRIKIFFFFVVPQYHC